MNTGNETIRASVDEFRRNEEQESIIIKAAELSEEIYRQIVELVGQLLDNAKRDKLFVKVQNTVSELSNSDIYSSITFENEDEKDNFIKRVISKVARDINDEAMSIITAEMSNITIANVLEASIQETEEVSAEGPEEDYAGNGSTQRGFYVRNVEEALTFMKKLSVRRLVYWIGRAGRDIEAKILLCREVLKRSGLSYIKHCKTTYTLARNLEKQGNVEEALEILRSLTEYQKKHKNKVDQEATLGVIELLKERHGIQ